ncbi:MAG: DoxX family protein [Pedobacter sp.]|nr:DoxX family protein [Pedobacter sp.]
MSSASLQAYSKTAAISFVFIWFAVGGLGHFVAADFFIKIVPPYIPYPEAAVYVSGVFELLGAVGLLLPQWRRLAGIGLFALTLCVTPANVHMFLHPEQFPLMPQPWLSDVLGFRLLLQVFLLFCIWWGPIRTDKAPVAAN